MIYPAYEVYKTAETAAITAQLNLSRARLEQAVDNAVIFYDSTRLWKANAQISQVIPKTPVPVTATYSADTRKLKLTSGTWPSWATGQLVIAEGAFLLGDVSGDTADVKISSRRDSGQVQGHLYEFRFKLPQARNVRMVSVEGIDKPLAPISERQILQALQNVYLPRPPYYYFWDPGSRELIVLPQASGVVLHVVETRSCRQGLASGASEEDHFGLVTANGTTVTGSNTRFDPYRHTGCLIYFSLDLAVPDRALTARRIVSVSSPTELVVDEPVVIENPSEFRITAAIKASPAGFELIKLTAALDVVMISGRGADSYKAAYEAALRAAIREDVEKTKDTILDPERIPEWIQRSPVAW